MNPAEITLAERIESIRLTRDVTAKYIDQLGYSVARFGRWLGHVPTLADLTTDVLNAYLIALRDERELTAVSIRNARRNLLVLWHDAIQEGLLTEATQRVRRIKTPRPIPKAWNAGDMLHLLSTIDAEKAGCFKRSKVRRRWFWRALVLTAWDTGLRLGDLLELRTADVFGKSEFEVTQSKNGVPVFCRLKPETMHAIESTYPPQRERVFGDALGRDCVMRQMTALVKAAGLTMGGLHKIRRSAATAVELSAPGPAMAFLGHLTPDLAYRHYVDRGMVQRAKPMPPALVEEPYLCQLVEEGADAM